MSSVSSAGGGTSAKGLSSGYNPAYHYNEDYDDTEEPSCKKYTTTNNQPIKIKGGDVKAEDSDTDDSDEELGNMIYESSRTAKKFREEAESVQESESHASSKNTQLNSNGRSPERDTTPATNECTKVKRRKACSREGCTNKAREGGVCCRHGAKKKICSHEGCTNRVQKWGVCIRHGAILKKRICRHEGCTNVIVRRGVCKRHGAKVKRRTCSHEGCTNNAIKGGVCKRHGAPHLSDKKDLQL